MEDIAPVMSEELKGSILRILTLSGIDEDAAPGLMQTLAGTIGEWEGGPLAGGAGGNDPAFIP